MADRSEKTKTKDVISSDGCCDEVSYETLVKNIEQLKGIVAKREKELMFYMDQNKILKALVQSMLTGEHLK